MKDGILLVEDSNDDTFLIRDAFKRQGWTSELEVVRDGVEAIEYLQGSGPYADRSRFKLPDLMLLDLKIPYFDGFQLLAWVKRQPGLRDLPVVISSDCDYVEDANKAYRLGAHSYFVKTNGFSDLVKLSLSMYRYCQQAKEDVNAKMPTRVWPSNFTCNPLTEVRGEEPIFNSVGGLATTQVMN